jgi:ADP-ribosylglycohydrolase
MLGAIVGDIVGSIYEGSNIKTTEFPFIHELCFFTDDTVLTIAVADAILEGGTQLDRHDLYIDKFHDYFCMYPGAGYGDSFFRWADFRRRTPYGSWGNGSAMRVSPIGYAHETLEEVLQEAKISAEVTHDHPEGIKGAQAVASAVYLACHRTSKAEIRSYIEKTFEYDLNETIDEIRQRYYFDVSCQGSVPQALIAFMEGEGFEDAVRKAISIGGDSDTIGCITGAVAGAFWGVPDEIADRAMGLLDDRLRAVVEEFSQAYCERD